MVAPTPDIDAVRAERLASLRTLASGLANEINAPLTSLLANIEHVVRRLRARGADDREDIEELAVELPALVEALSRAVDAAGRVRQLTHDLMVFSRAGVERRRLIDVRSVVESALHLASPEIRGRATLVRSLGEVPPVEADEGRLAQALIGILVNAAQSIPETGGGHHEVRVSTGTDAQGRAVIEISDTGRGMGPDVLGHVFDPFFTTRPARGLGMGLAIAHGTVTSLGGEMDVESEVGEGSLVRLVLPAAPMHRSEPWRVLIVAEESVEGEAIARALGEDHAATVARTPGEALARIEGEAFDAILCDAHLADMCAVDFFAEAVRRAPGVAERIVFLTGGAMTPRARALLAGMGHRCLEKPPDLARLRELIRRVGHGA